MKKLEIRYLVLYAIGYFAGGLSVFSSLAGVIVGGLAAGILVGRWAREGTKVHHRTKADIPENDSYWIHPDPSR